MIFEADTLSKIAIKLINFKWMFHDFSLSYVWSINPFSNLHNCTEYNISRSKPLENRIDCAVDLV